MVLCLRTRIDSVRRIILCHMPLLESAGLTRHITLNSGPWHMARFNTIYIHSTQHTLIQHNTNFMSNLEWKKFTVLFNLNKKSTITKINCDLPVDMGWYHISHVNLEILNWKDQLNSILWFDLNMANLPPNRP